MVLAQTDSTAAEALMLLRAYAFSHGRSLKDTAGEVVARRLDLTPPADKKEKTMTARSPKIVLW